MEYAISTEYYHTCSDDATDDAIIVVRLLFDLREKSIMRIDVVLHGFDVVLHGTIEFYNAFGIVLSYDA